MTEDELRAELARLAQERKAAMIACDVERVLAIRAEIGRITADIHRLRVNGKRRGVAESPRPQEAQP